MERKNRGRIFPVLFAILLVLLVATTTIFAACSKSTTALAPAQVSSSSTPAQTSSSPTPTAAKPIVLKLASPEPPDMFTVKQIFEPLIAQIETLSGGRVKIEPYWAETLVPLPDSYDAVVNDVADMAHGFPNMVAGRFRMDEVINFPTYNLQSWRSALTMWQLYEQFPEMQAEYKDVHFLFPMTSVWVLPGTVKKPIRQLEDMQGMKTIVSSETIGMRVETLGGAPVPVPPGEVYSSLEKGVVDCGAIFNADTLYAFRWGEVIKYLTVVPIGRMPMFVIMNKDKWNSLPPDIQDIFNQVSGAAAAELSDKVRWSIEVNNLPKVTTDFGIELIHLSQDELARWVEADKPAQQKYIDSLNAQGLPGQAFFNAYLQLDKKYAAPEYEVK